MNPTILLCTDGSPAAEIATQYAVWYAQALGGRLRALYVTDIRVLEGPLLADLSGALGAQPYSALLPQIQQLQIEKANTILRAAQDRCGKQQITCEAVHETGNLVSVILAAERHADLVVLGQHGEHAPWHSDLLGSTVERLVRASTKPCLVTPDKFRAVRHLLLAYDDSAESTKALRAGLDLAVTLGAAVTIITVCLRESEDAASKFLQDAHRQALDRKLTAHAQLLHGNAETEILSAAEKFSADLIVMGAYGHTRIRELILGSTTSHVLRKANIPVLLMRG